MGMDADRGQGMADPEITRRLDRLSREMRELQAEVHRNAEQQSLLLQGDPTNWRDGGLLGDMREVKAGLTDLAGKWQSAVLLGRALGLILITASAGALAARFFGG